MPTKKRKTATKRKSSASIASRGRAIMAKAKQIRKAHPTMKWTSCVSKAAKSR